ncbi:uncharacterized protein DDB_G0284459-like isoform X1 [Strongylocentrotus purpuratus]|uniref:CIDE-N domain-containing protein n=1 Tax=Strongylocentrotus purpuratus TaxID=7668 RepID=A0A7M7NRG8_STRPU|nr:uncharacterized protein DDB_G0284459-like isoform X1 [Strongylocentrotus purpuratus]
MAASAPAPRMFKVWHAEDKKLVLAKSLDELIEKGLAKLQKAREHFKCLRLSDGTDVDDDELFAFLQESEPVHFVFNDEEVPSYDHQITDTSEGEDDVVSLSSSTSTSSRRSLVFSTASTPSSHLLKSVPSTPTTSTSSKSVPSTPTTSTSSKSVPSTPTTSTSSKYVPSTPTTSTSSVDSDSDTAAETNEPEIITTQAATHTSPLEKRHLKRSAATSQRQATIGEFLGGGSVQTVNFVKKAKILREDGKNARYNSTVNKGCTEILNKNLFILTDKGGKGKLLKMGKEVVNKTYVFAKGKSVSKKAKAIQGEGLNARWTKTARSERMQELEEKLEGIKKDMQIAESNCNIKVSCEKFEEAESLRDKIKILQQRQRVCKIEIIDLQKRDHKAKRDLKYIQRKKDKEIPSDDDVQFVQADGSGATKHDDNSGATKHDVQSNQESGELTKPDDNSGATKHDAQSNQESGELTKPDDDSGATKHDAQSNQESGELTKPDDDSGATIHDGQSGENAKPHAVQ